MNVLLLLLLASATGLVTHSAVAETAPRSFRITSDDARAKQDMAAKAPASCADIKEKHDCLKHGSQEGDCAWCKGEYMPASCMSVTAAKYLPDTVAKCKLSKKHKEAAATAGVADTLNKKKKPAKAPASCGDNKEKHDCLKLGSQEGDCAWCAGGFMPDSCLSATAAKYLPEMVAKCKLPKKHKKAAAAAAGVDTLNKKKKPAKAPATCGDNKKKHDCLKLGSQEGDCAWCAGGFMPDSCLSATAAKYLPEMVAKCKLPKKHKAISAEVASGKDVSKTKAPTSCGDNKEKGDCLKVGAQESGCAWCKGDLMPASCVAVDAARWIPEMVAHCKLPKGKKDASIVSYE